MTSYEGKILIAHPGMPKDNPFYKSVVYIYQDTPNGTIGVIINKVSRYTVQDICADKKIVFLDNNAHVYHGGPVNPNALVLLHSSEWHSANTISAGHGMHVSSDNEMLIKIAKGHPPKSWRLFGGMSMWQPGQLAAEMAGSWPYRIENSWCVAEVPSDFILDLHHSKQWQLAMDISSHQLFDKYFE